MARRASGGVWAVTNERKWGMWLEGLTFNAAPLPPPNPTPRHTHIEAVEALGSRVW